MPNVQAQSARLFSFFNKWVALPLGVFVLASAEFSRYLVYWEPLRPILAPRTLLVLMVLTTSIWLVLGMWSRQVRLVAADFWWLGVPILLGLWSLLGLLWSPAADARTYLTEFWIYGLSLTLLLGVVGQPVKNRWWFAGAAFVGVALVIGIALLEKITDTHLPLSNLHNPYREQWAVTSVFINQNHLAASLAIFLPLLLGAALSHKRLRWLLLLIAGGGLVVLFFTGSTLAWLGLLLALLIMGLIELAFAGRVRNKYLTGLVATGLGVALVAAVWIGLPSSVRERFSVAAEGVCKSVAERIELLRVGTELTLEQPLRGLGPGAAEDAVRALAQTRVQNLHSLFLEVVVNFRSEERR